jgi:raffinose/stachyose/melibiose transport system permease protein
MNVTTEQTRQLPALGYNKSHSVEKWLTIAFFLVPPAAVYTWLVILPVIQAVQFSLYQWNGLGPLTDFVGLDNFMTAIFNDDIFRTALGNNTFIIAMSLLAQLPLALGLAVLLNSKLWGRAAFRIIFFMPFVVSEVITGILFTYIFRPTSQGGLVNAILGLVGIKGPAWMGEPDIVMYAIFATLTWKYFGYYVVLFLAGLQGIPAELKEAARIDGAARWGVFRHVTLPLLRPTITLTIFLSVIGSLQVFDLVWAMTRGGPVSASETMATYMYRSGFIRQQLGYGSAIAIIIFIIALSFSLIYQRYIMRRDLEGVY